MALRVRGTPRTAARIITLGQAAPRGYFLRFFAMSQPYLIAASAVPSCFCGV